MNTQKKIIVFFLFLTASTGIYAQNSTKITTALSESIKNKGLNETYTVWIYLKDKGNNSDKKQVAASYNLSKHTLERRKKLLKNQPLTDFCDIQIEKSYIKSLLPLLINLRNQSKWLNAVSATVKGNQLEQITSLSFVKSIDLVRKIKYLGYNKISTKKQHIFSLKKSNYNLNYGASFTQLELINVPIIHDMGYTGKGVIVCVLDAGFNNLEHQAFNNLDILDAYDFVNKDNNVDDEADFGNGNHGTMTLSTIGGFYEGELIGPAYGATYILAKTENTDSETQVEEDNWVAAVEWAEALGADITSTSLGYLSFDDGTTYSASELNGNTAVITIASDIAAKKGLLIVNSAGNEGSGITTIIAPADGDSVLAVGAVNADGVRTSFSSVGPTGDGRIKPDIMAMGANIYVADVTEDNYRYANGTSFSCPLTAGAAALLWEIFPFASNMELIDAIKKTANHADNPNNEYGWGVLDSYAAYNFLVPKYSYSATFNITNKNKPVEGAEIIFKTNKTTTDINGYAVFQDILANKNIEYTISKPGFCTYSDTLPAFNQNTELNIELIKTSVSVYPSPASNYLIFNIKEDKPDNNELLFYNLTGRLIKIVKRYQNKSELDISEFSDGIYFVQIKINNSVYLKKIMVSK